MQRYHVNLMLHMVSRRMTVCASTDDFEAFFVSATYECLTPILEDVARLLRTAVGAAIDTLLERKVDFQKRNRVACCQNSCPTASKIFRTAAFFQLQAMESPLCSGAEVTGAVNRGQWRALPSCTRTVNSRTAQLMLSCEKMMA